MQLGPVEYIVIEFPGNHLKGDIVPALRNLVVSGQIRILDLVFVRKSAEGVVQTFELGTLDPSDAAMFDDLDGEIRGLVNDDDLESVAANLAPDDDLVGGGGFGKAGVPTSDPLGGPVNKWLTSSHLLDYPHYGGDGLVSPTGLQFAAGQARKEVARVTGVDTQGREHEAKLVGKEQGWPTQQYFIVVREPIQLKTYKAYDAHGKLLGSVTSEDFWDWPDN